MQPLKTTIVQCTCLRPSGYSRDPIVSGHWSRSAIRANIPDGFRREVLMPQAEEFGNIDENRNQIVVDGLGLRPRPQLFAWLDDDVIPVSCAVWTTLYKHILHGADIASGVYFTRSDPAEFIFFDAPSVQKKFVPNEVGPAWGGPMGLTLVKTEVYERMLEEIDLGKDKRGNPRFYMERSVFTDDDGNRHWFTTEDLFFYWNAAKLGFKMILDCTVHAFGFHYDFGLHSAFPGPQWNQYLNGRPITWHTDKGQVVW